MIVKVEFLYWGTRQKYCKKIIEYPTVIGNTTCIGRQ